MTEGNLSESPASFGWATEDDPLRTSPARLCQFCQKTIQQWAKRFSTLQSYSSDTFPYHNTLSALKTSAQRGCGICVQFGRERDIQQAHNSLKYGNSHGDASRGTSGSMGYQRSESSLISCWHLWCRFMDMHGSVVVDYIINIIPTTTQGYSYKPLTPLITENTQAALPLCKAWLLDCLKHHNHKRLLVQTPTRLLRLDNDSVRLCSSAELRKAPHLDYATVSHCWGKESFLTLKKSNIKAFEDKVPEEALTKTIRDAITIAKNLGINYLWIDSLCIVQDDQADWQKEAALMGIVYGCSIITIAASSAAEGSVGCFFDRSISWKCQIQIGLENQRQFFEVIPSTSESTKFNTPLLSRAWVMQERILSTRTLHFTACEVFWECDHHFSSEKFPDELPNHKIWDTEHLKAPETLEEWYRFVGKYTSCELTYPSDKLVAISSIARGFHSNAHDEYVAGMWRRHLEIQLVWYVEKRRGRITPYAAPTWSWASIDGNVDVQCFSIPAIYPDMTIDPLEWDMNVTVDQLDITLASGDPFGAVLHISLRLACKHIFKLEMNRDMQWKANGEGLEFLFRRSPFQTYSAWESGFTQFHLDSPPNKRALVQAFIVPLVFDVGWISSSYYLVLQHTHANSKQFERIGILSHKHNENNRGKNIDFLPQLILAIPQDWEGNNDGVEVRVDEQWGKRYVIEIV